jgi:hypothetical protein
MKITVTFDVDIKDPEVDAINIRERFGQYLYYMLDMDIGEDDEFVIKIFHVERALFEV